VREATEKQSYLAPGKVSGTITKLIFNSNGEGTITVIRQDGPDKYSIVETVKTAPRAKTMALDPKTHRLFLSTAENGQFEVLVVGK
jgi:hypothetical protein